MFPADGRNPTEIAEPLRHRHEISTWCCRFKCRACTSLVTRCSSGTNAGVCFFRGGLCLWALSCSIPLPVDPSRRSQQGFTIRDYNHQQSRGSKTASRSFLADSLSFMYQYTSFQLGLAHPPAANRSIAHSAAPISFSYSTPGTTHNLGRMSDLILSTNCRQPIGKRK